MKKSDVVAVLREMADLLEVAEADAFEVMAYRAGAQSLEEWSGDLSNAVADHTMTHVPAIGKGLAQIIYDLVERGRSDELDRVRGLVPVQLPLLLRVRGLGPKRVRTLWRQLNVQSPDDLREAAEAGRIETLRGFGAKTVERILSGLDYLEQSPPSRVKRKPAEVRLPRAAAASGRVLAGISGYSYASWKGNFYPVDAPSSSFLEHYAERLSTVEVNNTFYRFPSEKVIAQWVDQTPEKFLFSVKAHRRITHQLRLGPAASEHITEFVERCGQLGSRLGCVLFQLPPNLRYEKARLETLLEALPRGPRYAMEFRHESWLKEPIRHRLRAENIAIVSGETEDQRAERYVSADFVYARLPASFSPPSWQDWTSWLDDQCSQGRDALVYFKHDEDGAIASDVAARWGISAPAPQARKLAPSVTRSEQLRKRG